MLATIANLALTRTKTVLIGLALLVPALAVLGGGVADRLSTGGFDDPQSESSRAATILEDRFAAGPANYFLVVTARSGRVEAATNTSAGLALTRAVGAEPGVAEVTSFWTLNNVPVLANPLRSTDGTQAIVAASLSGDLTRQEETAAELNRLTGQTGDFDIKAGGEIVASVETAEQAERDLRDAELIATPLTLIALLVVFRGWRAASLPMIVAIISVLGTFVVLSAITLVSEVSTFALNLTTALGLGLAIDYSLLIVARYREELGAGRTGATALHRTMQTAGRTVLFSGATVAASMLSLLVFPVAYLRSFAYAGIAVVAMACTATIVIAPTLLAFIGPRIGATNNGDSEGFWHRQTERVVRHPVPWLATVVAILIGLGLPFLNISPGRIDEQVLPESAPARQAADDLRSNFNAQLNTLTVVAPTIAPDNTDLIGAIERSLLATPGVVRVESARGTTTAAGSTTDTTGDQRFVGARSTWLSVTTDASPGTAAAEDTVRTIRTVLERFDEPLLVGGETASTVDAIDAVVERIPIAIALIAGTTLVLLFAMSGSIVIPIKALVLNLLSLTATFGALVWIFQDGNFAQALGATATGRLDVFTPILMFCIAFGLSMDYEVFLLSRIKEEYDLCGDNDDAVIAGIGHTGRLVTAAAVLLSLVFISISTSSVTVVKMFGVGLTIAIITDAFAIRATLTPALMTLAGRKNWWAPSRLRTLHLRWGFWENDPISLPEAQNPEQPAHLSPEPVLERTTS